MTDMRRRMEIRKGLPKITQTYLRVTALDRSLVKVLDRLDTMREHAQGERERMMSQIIDENTHVAELARMGVTFGEPVEVDEACSMCTWHAENPTEDRSDGGNASAILSWVREGYLGDPKNVVLHPVKR